MVHRTFHHTSDFPASILQTPAQVYLFHVSKKIRVKPTILMKQFCPYDHTGARGPEDIHGLVILAYICFQLVEDAPPAVRISQTVDKPTCGAGVFKVVFFLVSFDLGLCAGIIGMIIQKTDQGYSPVRRHFHIRIDQKIVVCGYSFQCFVVSSGKTVVLFQYDQLNLRPMVLHPRHRVIGGGIVRHHESGTLTVFV